jgi:hypothetical protein
VNVKLLLAILASIIIVESTVLAIPYLAAPHVYRPAYPRSYSQSVSFAYSIFNQPISNDTEYELNPGIIGSWEVDVHSSLTSVSSGKTTEAQVALAPAYISENRSIPTIIVQERADGLVRVEYFAQNWPNSYGLLLYNSSAPGWIGGRNVTLVFRSLGPPSAVDPQLAPRPNGNVDVLVGGVTVLSEYSIAWANLSDLYLYGYPGSSFTGGSVQISFYQI